MKKTSIKRCAICRCYITDAKVEYCKSCHRVVNNTLKMQARLRANPNDTGAQRYLGLKTHAE